jgi:hypothetical protein
MRAVRRTSAPVRNHILPIVGLILSFAPGCTRGVCDVEGASFDPISSTWQGHKDLVPANATVCGHFKKGPGVEVDMSKVLQIDFENDPNPFVTIVDHLEKKGLTRTSQDITSADNQTVSFSKDKKTFLRVSTIRQKGRFRAVLSLED